MLCVSVQPLFQLVLLFLKVLNRLHLGFEGGFDCITLRLQLLIRSLILIGGLKGVRVSSKASSDSSELESPLRNLRSLELDRARQIIGLV